jgi:hypothetical protein
MDTAQRRDRRGTHPHPNVGRGPHQRPGRRVDAVAVTALIGQLAIEWIRARLHPEMQAAGAE